MEAWSVTSVLKKCELTFHNFFVWKKMKLSMREPVIIFEINQLLLMKLVDLVMEKQLVLLYNFLAGSAAFFGYS